MQRAPTRAIKVNDRPIGAYGKEPCHQQRQGDNHGSGDSPNEKRRQTFLDC